MKLYKQLITDEQTISDPILINEYATIEDAKREAERIANNDNCKDITWISFLDASDHTRQPYELSVNNEYKLVIREW